MQKKKRRYYVRCDFLLPNKLSSMEEGEKFVIGLANKIENENVCKRQVIIASILTL